jgi:hypothetical protein
VSGVESKARSNFAAQHLAAAEYFRSQVAEIERVLSPFAKTLLATPVYPLLIRRYGQFQK